MNPIITDSIQHSKFNNLKDSIQNKEKHLSITGLTDEAQAHVIYSLYNYTNVRPIFVCPNMSIARKFAQNLKFYSETEIVLFPPREYMYYTTVAKDRNEENERIYAVKKVLSNSDILVVTTIDAVSERMLPKEAYNGLNFSISVGESVDIEELIKKLDKLGYVREDTVTAKGKYSVRGGIIDIFVIDDISPVRIELFGNEIDTIRRFDIDTQRSIENIDKIDISFSTEFVIPRQKIEEVANYLENLAQEKPLEEKEMLLEDADLIKTDIKQVVDKYYNLLVENSYSFIDYLDDNYAIYFNEISKCINRSGQITEEENEIIKLLTSKKEIDSKMVATHFSFNEIIERTNRLSDVYLSRLNQDRVLHAKRKEYSFSCREVNFFRSSMDLFIKEIKKFKTEEKIILITLSTDIKIDMMIEALNSEKIAVTKLYNVCELQSLKKGTVYITKAFVTNGYVIDDLEIVVASEELTNIKKSNIKISSQEILGDSIKSFDDLQIGDYVVHITYGIGKYLGTETITTEHVLRDYIKIEYKDSSALYIPITSLDLIRKYVVEEGFVPKLNSLTSNAWEKTKQRVKAHVKDIAKELILLYAQRKEMKGFKFSKDTPWQREFEADFEYELTDDQARAVEDMKNDMERGTPMDRILCGDVGYGKTEVAIRGAFKAVMNSKQVAYLVPTTVLCSQQLGVFKNRMEKFGIKVEMLSRLKSAKEQEKILKELKEGSIDVLVGTHRMLSNDVAFKDLGMLIIDEEHKFGVEHKERIKKLRKNVDVLSMTATPIPRTLHMSMIGIYDISVILEPPLERLPIKTYVLEYDESIIKDAIETELARDGQIIYLSNKVENIEEVTAKVRRLANTNRVDFAHGKMNPKDIEDKMINFVNHDTDILVSTTILESGIDIPNANTLIIENADRLGLASLYQIRGRVGRSSRLAYAYITYKKNNVITEEAMKRLTAIKDYTEFGSGLKIALKDLEIRGAGNILGAEQHGHMISVGYDMYASLLKEAIENEKKNLGETISEKIEELQDVKINIDVSANIPDDYINNSVLKINMYQKLSTATDDTMLQDVVDELIDRFGELPTDTKNLLDIISIRNMARKLKIKEISEKGSYLVYVSDYGQNNIKYKLTDTIKCDILSFVKSTLSGFIKSMEVNIEKG